MAKLMRAARLHASGDLFRLDTVPMPALRAGDVLVRVAAASVMPNLRSVVADQPARYPFLVLPRLPAILGLDATGVVVGVGTLVSAGIAPGDRVYVNPVISCGACEACRRADFLGCASFTLLGCFGLGSRSRAMLEAYPYGGFGEYLIAPASSLVKLHDTTSFEQGARFGALGNAYSALRKAGFSPGQTVLVDGATGVLGLATVMLAMSMGAGKIFATGRDRRLLDRLQRCDPARIVPILRPEEAVADVVMEATGCQGADVLVVARGASTSAAGIAEGLDALRRGGKAMRIGSFAQSFTHDAGASYRGSLGFATAEVQDVASMAGCCTLDLRVFDTERFSLPEVNDAFDAIEQREGGFTNIVVTP